jgi:hypothetical protein
MKIRVKHIIFLLILDVLSIPLLNLTYRGVMNYSGYCFAENRYLTADEKIRIAFNHFNSMSTRARRFYKETPYCSFEEYVKANLDCCSVGKRVFSNLPPDDFFDRISGDNSGKIVTINFKSNYFDPEISSFKAGEIPVHYVLTNCGKVKTRS